MELNLGVVSNVVVKPTLMDYRMANYMFDRQGNVSGWDEVRTFQVEVKNTREIPATVEIRRNFPTTYWDLTAGTPFERVDQATVKFTLELPPRTAGQFDYTLTTYHGERENA